MRPQAASEVTSSPELSVVLPTYRRPHLLGRAIASVLAQTWTDFELLVVDDASGDATAARVREHGDPRIHYLPHPANRGVAATRNTGVTAARGRWITFLDDDDELLPHYLERARDVLRQAPPGVAWSWCGMIYLDEVGEEVARDLWRPEFADLEDAYRGFLRTRRIGTSGLTVGRHCFETLGLFDESYRSAEDTEFLIRLAHAFHFAVVPEFLLRVHHHAGPRLRRQPEETAASYERLLEQHRGILGTDRRLRRDLCYKTAWLHFHAGEPTPGRQRLMQALRADPLFLKGWLVLGLFGLAGRRGTEVHRRLSAHLSRRRNARRGSP